MPKFEVVVPCRYLLTPDAEVGSFTGVAYKKEDGTVRTELLWGTDRKVSVKISGEMGQDFMYAYTHTFVERYINQCLKRPFIDVEIFRFYMSRGEFPEAPTDLQGEILRHFKDPQQKDVWTSYEHISGPWLANTEYVISQLSAGRLDDISAKVTTNLIPDRSSYLQNPQDLPIVGIIQSTDESSIDQRLMEDLIIRQRIKKPQYIN